MIVGSWSFWGCVYGYFVVLGRAGSIFGGSFIFFQAVDVVWVGILVGLVWFSLWFVAFVVLCVCVFR